MRLRQRDTYSKEPYRHFMFPKILKTLQILVILVRNQENEDVYILITAGVFDIWFLHAHNIQQVSQFVPHRARPMESLAQERSEEPKVGGGGGEGKALFVINSPPPPPPPQALFAQSVPAPVDGIMSVASRGFLFF